MINIKTPEEIMVMAEGGRILAEILKRLAEAVKPGIATKDLDELARELASAYKVKPAFLGYNNFPAAVCVSVNDEVVHGIPSGRKLITGDIVGIDMGIVHNGFFTDSALTVPVLNGLTHNQWAKVNPELSKLIETTKHALDSAIKKAVIGNHIGAISHEIQKITEKAGFNAIKDLSGHGIGRSLHEEPSVPNFGKTGDGPALREGMVIAIEPMLTANPDPDGWKVRLAPDRTTYLTANGSFSAHFEHTVAITREGPKILTRL